MNIKRKKKKNRLVPMACVMGIFVGSICNSYMYAYAEALPDFVSGSVTVADCVMSYMTSAGAFIANSDWIGTLYDGLGESFGTISDFVQNNMLTVDSFGNIVATQELEDAIAQTQAYGALNLDTLFNVSTAEAELGGGVAATGAGTLAGCIGGVATTGALPLAIGVTGAYWGGIGLGTLIAHAVGLYGRKVEQGIPITEVIQTVPAGTNMVVCGRKYLSGRAYYIDNANKIIALPESSAFAISGQPNSTVYVYAVYDNSDTVSTHGRYTLNNNGRYIGGTTGGNSNFSSVNPLWYGVNGNDNVFKNDFLSGVRSIPDRRSPDIITSDGNAVADYDQEGGITIPSMIPQINPDSGAIVPGGASREDWLRWADGAKGNEEINQPDDNADIFQDILDAIKRLTPTPTPNPNPNPNPTPTPVPKPDYDPSQPDQPDYDPKETEGPQDVTNGDPWTTPDLLDKFPFCLPRDVYRCFEKLDVNERMAPSISWHFTTPLGIHFDFDLELDDYEGVASILRTLELIAFIIGLALATRNLIGR